MKENFKILILVLVIVLGFSIFFLNKKIRFFSGGLFLASPKDFLDIEIIDNGGFGNSLALSLEKNPAVSFLDEERGLIFIQKLGGKWQEEIVDKEALAGNDTSLAFNSKGEANILYIDKNFSLKLATKINQEWKIEKIVDGAALSLNLLFDKEDNPLISFWLTSKGALAFAKKVNSKWQIEIVDSGEVGWWNDLALDKNQNPHISYFDFKNKDLLYAFFDGLCWRKEVVDFEEDVGRWNSILVQGDEVYISYFDEGNAKLKYAKKGKGGWEIESIDKSDTTGERTNIAQDEDGNLYISYFDLSYSDFKLAKKAKDDKKWQTFTIDEKGEVGGDNSLLIDKEGNIFLSWQDLSHKKLKYSVCKSWIWQ